METKKRPFEAVSTTEEPAAKRPCFGFARSKPPSAVPKLSDLAFALGVKALTLAGHEDATSEFDDDWKIGEQLSVSSFAELLGAFSMQEIAVTGTLSTVPEMAAAVRAHSESKADTVSKRALEIFDQTDRDFKDLPGPSTSGFIRPDTVEDYESLVDELDQGNRDFDEAVDSVAADLRQSREEFADLRESLNECDFPEEADDVATQVIFKLDEPSMAAYFSLLLGTGDRQSTAFCNVCKLSAFGMSGLCNKHMASVLHVRVAREDGEVKDSSEHTRFGVGDSEIKGLFATGEITAGSVISYLWGTRLIGAPHAGRRAIEVRDGEWIAVRPSWSVAAAARSVPAAVNAQFEFAKPLGVQVIALVALIDIKSGSEILVA